MRFAGTKRLSPFWSWLITWTMEPGVPLVAVAVKVVVELRPPPSTRASADCGPLVPPKVQMLELMPSASVRSDVGVSDPPLPVDQVTVTPDAGAPSRVTSTRSSLGSGCPAGPVWVSPLLVPALAMIGAETAGPLSPLQPSPATAASASALRLHRIGMMNSLDQAKGCALTFTLYRNLGKTRPR